MIHRIEHGQHLRAAGDGTWRVHVNSKKSIVLPRFDVSNGALPSLGTGYIVYSWWRNDSGKPVTQFRTRWVVPKEPSNKSDQLVFLFNGLVSFDTGGGILQPVLQWGSSYAGGGQYWSIASWFVTKDHQAFYTPLMRVNEGDKLVGVMKMTASSAGRFDYTAEFEGIAGTSLPVCAAPEMTDCYEALEAYRIEQCSDYPASLYTRMASIHVDNSDGLVTPRWNLANEVTDCGQHVALARTLIPFQLPPPLNLTVYLSHVDVMLYYRRATVRAADWQLVQVRPPI